MISAHKVFGQYELKPATAIYKHHLKDSDDEEFVSTCTISTRWTPLTLIGVTPYNEDTSLFCFSLVPLSRHPTDTAPPASRLRLDLPVGSCMLVRAPNCEHLPMGGDAIRPYTSISSEEEIRKTGCFTILVKRYAEWGKKETPQTHFLFTKTNHTYRPAGAVSNFIHQLNVGDTLEFKHTGECIGRFPNPIPLHAKYWTLIAVGVGIAPMINIIRHLLLLEADTRIVLLYGAREVKDILMFQVLEQLSGSSEGRFSVVYCIGSRWANVHLGAKTKESYVHPHPPLGFALLQLDRFSFKEIGWVSEEKIRKYGFLPHGPSSVVCVCGLPGVYEKICGSRFTDELEVGSALHRIGFSSEQVLKL